MDDYYEYRHVILPKETYKKMQRGRLLTESVHHHLFRNGEPWESNNPEDGFTTNYTDHNPTSCCSGDPRAATLKPDFLHRVSSPQPTPSATEQHDIIIPCSIIFIHHQINCPTKHSFSYNFSFDLNIKRYANPSFAHQFK